MEATYCNLENPSVLANNILITYQPPLFINN